MPGGYGLGLRSTPNRLRDGRGILTIPGQAEPFLRPWVHHREANHAPPIRQSARKFPGDPPILNWIVKPECPLYSWI